MKTMFEIKWHWLDKNKTPSIFSYCSVHPIKVIREGVLPGCSGVTITAIDITGRKFQGNPSNYFKTEKQAWAQVKKELRESVKSLIKQKKEIEKDILAHKRFLAKICEPA